MSSRFLCWIMSSSFTGMVFLDENQVLTKPELYRGKKLEEMREELNPKRIIIYPIDRR